MKKFLLFVLVFTILVGAIFIQSFNVFALNVNNNIFDTFTAKSYVLYDFDSKMILIEEKSNERYQVASICKLMTTLLTLEKIESGSLRLDDKFCASEYACSVEGSQAFLDANCEYSVRDLLKSVIVASANDSAIVLAENIAGNEKHFVDKMNERANEIGMLNTLYENATGLETANQYSTAYDTALLLNELQDYEIYKENCRIWIDKLVHPSGRETELVNTNRLIKYYNGCTSGKTGYTDQAGYCLSSTATKNNMNLTAVVLGCETSANRFKESMELYNYGFANFSNKLILSKDKALNQSLAINNGNQSNINIYVEDDFYLLTNNEFDRNIQIKYDIPSKINAPIIQGDVVGKCYILEDGKIINEMNIVVKDSVEQQKLKDILYKICKDWNLE